MARPVRIANFSGFYGDRMSAAHEQVTGGPIDVLTGDHLAELTLLILLKDRMKDPRLGYARTFLPQLESVLVPCLDRGIKVVSNAGGLNPHGLAEAVAQGAAKLGLKPRIAVLTGDDVTARLGDWQAAGHRFPHLGDGRPLGPEAGMPLAANVYLGGHAIAEALRQGADIVITGRVTDAAVVMGPAAWHHGWGPDDLDALAGALAAGHVIECGTQATGGNYSFYEEVPSLRDLGFPIAEIAEDGSAVITKHPGTGGLVDVGTVTAQLLYEIGPPAYLSPDVVARFDTLTLEDLGDDRVRLSGVRGEPAPQTLKLGIQLGAGWRNQVVLLLGGDDPERKAALVEAAFWPQVGGRERFAEARADLLVGARPGPTSPQQTLSTLTLSVRDLDRDEVDRRFTSRAVELALASVPGLTLAALPGPAQACGAFWPTRVDRDEVPMTLHLDGERPVDHPPRAEAAPVDPLPAPPAPVLSGRTVEVRLGDLVGTRSGDKAGDANVGFWVRRPEHFAWLSGLITEDQLRAWLAETGWSGRIRRWELPNLLAVNVVLEGFLGAGVGASIQPDPQAKCLGEYFRSLRAPIDAALLGG